MQVQVISNVNEACSAKFCHKTAIVIDALRATSTIATALAAGASSVKPVETVMEAREYYAEGDVLGGERFCRRISGFQLGNSPDEYAPETVAGRRVILTTTNGTRAILKSLRAHEVIAASFLNGGACAAHAARQRRDIVIICAGSHNEFAIEDGLCAGFLLNRLLEHCSGDLALDDFGAAMHSLYNDRKDAICNTLSAGATGRRLAKLGQSHDIEACSRRDLYSNVPIWRSGQLIDIS
ncbi:2-phosphosulfolactate phosphatase [Paenibacillus sp. J5C_2022]|uniref:2-phosphosulfolactate phosphatase n=1 Tax=Paenibacillus sp. J5C2022 TaxID=2977129 RepID=UPI0021CECC25|nr:2-phosphosulfolactate phosphatase [Paenibacillus sp. J5C2022]MCU6710154.1 2-phosphosulfolactate phosphatase [Paenibacillus sp. J5C2022]